MKSSTAAVDPAILEALNLDPAHTKISSHGGSGFSSTFKVTSSVGGGDGDREEVVAFVKTGRGRDAEVMFRGEHASLNAINAIVPTLCPKSLAHGSLRNDPQTHFLATEFLDLSSSLSSSRVTLAQKLAKLHTTPVPPPSQYGFPVTTCCGSTPQPNDFSPSWPEFFAENRLRFIVSRISGDNGELKQVVERTAEKVVPRLLGQVKGLVGPVVCHGDLWSGNHGKGRFLGRQEGDEVEEVVFDPSCVWGVGEYELGIMKMFGGFGDGFWREYEKLVPKAEPVDEWEDRILLYESYHHLNHAALFGGGYRSSAMSILTKLNAKYGKD